MKNAARFCNYFRTEGPGWPELKNAIDEFRPNIAGMKHFGDTDSSVSNSKNAFLLLFDDESVSLVTCLEQPKKYLWDTTAWDNQIEGTLLCLANVLRLGISTGDMLDDAPAGTKELLDLAIAGMEPVSVGLDNV
jgi:hypothetical protein